MTNSDTIAAAIRELRQYGWAEKYHAVTRLGRNTRLDELQAAVLRVKLPLLDAWNARRREIADRYHVAARDTALELLPVGTDSVAHLCVGLHPDRDRFRELLTGEGVGSAVHYPTPDHRQPALTGAPWRAAGLSVTESSADRVVSLPCFPELLDSEVDYVCEVIRKSA